MANILSAISKYLFDDEEKKGLDLPKPNFNITPPKVNVQDVKTGASNVLNAIKNPSSVNFQIDPIKPIDLNSMYQNVMATPLVQSYKAKGQAKANLNNEIRKSIELKQREVGGLPLDLNLGITSVPWSQLNDDEKRYMTENNLNATMGLTGGLNQVGKGNQFVKAVSSQRASELLDDVPKIQNADDLALTIRRMLPTGKSPESLLTQIVNKFPIADDLLKQLKSGAVLEGDNFVIQMTKNKNVVNLFNEAKELADDLPKLELPKDKPKGVNIKPPETPKLLEPGYKETPGGGVMMGDSTPPAPPAEPPKMIESGPIQKSGGYDFRQSKQSINNLVKQVRDVTGEVPEFLNKLKDGTKPITLTDVAEKLEHTNNKFVTASQELEDAIKNAQVFRPNSVGLEQSAQQTRRFLLEPVRFFEQVTGQADNVFKRWLLDNHAVNVATANKYADDMLRRVDEVVSQHGFKVGSDESAAIQLWGEKGLIAPGGVVDQALVQDLQRAFPEKWKGILDVVRTYRQAYDDTIDTWNLVRNQFGLEAIPKLDNYFHHFQAIGDYMDEFGLNMTKTQLPPEIAGETEYFMPNQTFVSAMLKRRGGEFTPDAIEGFNRYINSVSRSIFYTDSLQRLKQMIKIASEVPRTAKNADDVAALKEYLLTQFKQVGGKRNKLDEFVQETFGRPALSSMSNLVSIVGKNLVLYRIPIALVQTAQVPKVIAYTNPTDLVKGIRLAWDTSRNVDDIAQIGNETSQYLQGNFRNLRSVGMRLLSKSPSENTKFSEAGAALFEAVDLGVKRPFIAAKYLEALRMYPDMTSQEAMKYADDWAAKVFSDRRPGFMANAFSGKTLKAITQFQIEVNNDLNHLLQDFRFMRDAAGNKLTKKRLALMATMAYGLTHGYNLLMEELIGRRVSLDPVGIGAELLDTDQTLQQRLQKAGGMLVNQLPLTSVWAGGRVPVASVLPNANDMSELFRAKTKAEFGTKLAQMILNATLMLQPLGGGNQLKQSIKGITMAMNDGIIRDGRLQIPLDNTLYDRIRAVLFSPYANDQSRLYFELKMQPLTDEQTAIWEQMVANGESPVTAWAKIHQIRTIDSIKRAISSVIRDTTYTADEKRSIIEGIEKDGRWELQQIDSIINESINPTESSTQDTPNPANNLFDVEGGQPLPTGDSGLKLPSSGGSARTGVKLSTKVKAPPKFSVDIPNIKLSDYSRPLSSGVDLTPPQAPKVSLKLPPEEDPRVTKLPKFS